MTPREISASCAPASTKAATPTGFKAGLSQLAASGAVPVDAAGLAVFRIALGLSVAWFAAETLASSSLEADFIRPRMHLTYLGFDWVRPWPGSGMWIHFCMMLIAALGVVAGLFYRVSAVVMLLTFTHAFLIERALYNNHYYLIVLLALLASLLPLHCCWSVDAWRNPEVRRQTLPGWMLGLIRFQIGIVYFYGGIAKLNADWLRGQPMRMWLKAQTDYPLIGGLFGEEWMVQLFVWSGLLIDLLAVPGLLWRRTRVAMLVVLTIFHLLNSTLFSIGVFPWLMIALTTVFLSPDWPRRLFRRPSPAAEPSPEPAAWSPRQTVAATFVGLYVAVQVLVPLRQFLYSGDPSWTERGQLFSWRMMLRQKRSGIRLYVTDSQSGRRGVIDVSAHLNPRQAVAMSRDPDLVLQFAHKLAELLKQHGIPSVEIRAQVLAALNGRKPQHLIDPAVNLVAQQRGLWSYDWVVPLTEPYRHDDWQAGSADPVAAVSPNLSKP